MSDGIQRTGKITCSLLTSDVSKIEKKKGVKIKSCIPKPKISWHIRLKSEKVDLRQEALARGNLTLIKDSR